MRNQCHVLSYTPSHDPTSLQHPLPYGGGDLPDEEVTGYHWKNCTAQLPVSDGSTAAICSTTDVITVPSCTTTSERTKGQSSLGEATRIKPLFLTGCYAFCQILSVHTLTQIFTEEQAERQ